MTLPTHTVFVGPHQLTMLERFQDDPNRLLPYLQGLAQQQAIRTDQVVAGSLSRLVPKRATHRLVLTLTLEPLP